LLLVAGADADFESKWLAQHILLRKRSDQQNALALGREKDSTAIRSEYIAESNQPYSLNTKESK
jgi:hypothetical protein